MNETAIQKRFVLIGWLASLILHILVALVFLVIMVDVTPIIPEFAEVSFSQFVISESPVVSQDRSQAASLPASQSAVTQEESRAVNLPRRRMLDRDKETIPLDTKTPLQTEETVTRTAERIDPLKGLNRNNPVMREAPVSGVRRLPGTQKIEVGEKMTAPAPSKGVIGDINLGKPYEIRWEGGAREVLADRLPVFPENIHKEVILRFRIEVLPDGTVREITTLQKGEVTLEAVTRQALKQWIFTPLEQSAPQKSQSGVITFRFVLQ